MQRRQFRQRPGVAAGRVQQRALLGAAHQPLVLVLAVDLDQPLAGGAQGAQRGGGVVDVGARRAVARQHPPQQAGVVAEAALGEPRAEPGRVVRVAVEGDLGARRARADQAAAGAVAEHQADGVDQDRLAGAGLAAEHVHAGPQLQLQPLDHGEVADGQAAQHGYRFQDSLRRSSSKWSCPAGWIRVSG